MVQKVFIVNLKHDPERVFGGKRQGIFRTGIVLQGLFNGKNVGLTDQELTIQLKSLGYDLVAFLHGIVNTIHTGHFTYTRGDAPSNLSAFCYYKDKALISD